MSAPFANYYAGKRVLVTGHTGFKGAWLSLWLHRLGAQVTGFSLPAISPGLHEVVREKTFAAETFGDIRDALAALNAYTAERIAGIEILQLYSQESRAGARFRGLDERHRDANVVNNWYDAFLFAFIDGTASVCVALMLWVGSGASNIVIKGISSLRLTRR